MLINLKTKSVLPQQVYFTGQPQQDQNFDDFQRQKVQEHYT